MGCISRAADWEVTASQLILAGFDRYQEAFRANTRRARQRFELRQWWEAQQDAVQRLEIYKQTVDSVIEQVRQLLADHSKDEYTWAVMKSYFSHSLAGRDDYELAETFFNSITRRIFTTVGVDPQVEFVDSEFDRRPDIHAQPIVQIFASPTSQSGSGEFEVIRSILELFSFNVPFVDLENDARRAASVIDRRLSGKSGKAHLQQVEILRSVFYRDKGAFLVGRIQAVERSGRLIYCPLVLCLRNPPQGVMLDAVLLDEDDVSILFSFARSYFHVEVDVPHEVIAFLKHILPHKRTAELYISMGYNKHGKTELYRDLMHHMTQSDDRFELARGERGMVMVVFTLPSFDMVFKVISDRVREPKSVSRQEVMARYDLVFKHDRAGRLVDAQEFEYLSFERERFTDELLQELAERAPQQVTIHEDCAIIRHLYIERRMTPLNLYIQEAPADEIGEVVIDYGQVIKDLAATNIFPGDILLKNFGVTRHRRVVFYDYDELTLLSECNFRRMPQARDDFEEFQSDPWFYVSPNDIFPEQFRTFLGLPELYRSTFVSHHADLFEVAFWQQMQSRLAAGEVIDTYPYALARRL